MPRYYTTNDCDIYVERLFDKYHQEYQENHCLRKNPLENPCKIFRNPDHHNQSFICSWGLTENYRKNTGLECINFQKSRIRKNAILSVAGQSNLWKITRVDPCHFGKLLLHTWSLQNWLQESKTHEENLIPTKSVNAQTKSAGNSKKNRKTWQK